MKYRFQMFMLIVLIPAIMFYGYLEREDLTIREFFMPAVPVVTVGDVPVRVEVARSFASRVQGLSGRKDLGGVDGMLFIFDSTDYHQIWMKDMLFPIDIIWIDQEGVVINVERLVRPDTYPRIYKPDRPARYAIETEAQYSETFGIRPGDVVTFPSGIKSLID